MALSSLFIFITFFNQKKQQQQLMKWKQVLISEFTFSVEVIEI